MLSDNASRLPVEVTEKCFEGLSIQSLVAVMGVCRSWCAIGRMIPTYWRNIELEATSESALALFRRRLMERRTSCLKLSVRLPHEVHNTIFADAVVPLLAPHIPRCTQLHIHVHLDVDKHLIGALELQPAPSLEALTLAFYGESDDFWTLKRPFSIPLPPTLFASTAPRLRSIYIRAVDIYFSWPSAFSGVTKATLDDGTNGHHAVHLDLIGTYLPALRDLSLHGGEAVYLGLIEAPEAQNLLSRLDIMRVFLRTGMPWGLLYWPGAAAIRHIYTTDISTKTLEVMATHLGSHVYLSVEEGNDYVAGSEFVLQYVSLQTNICRSFAGFLRPRAEIDTELQILPGLAFLLDQLRRLEISAQLWAKLASSFTIPPLPACTDVIINLSCHVTLREMSSVPMPLQCPALCTVEVACCDALLRCTSGDISRLIESVFARAESRVRIVLRSVEVDGDLDPVSSWFDIVRS